MIPREMDKYRTSPTQKPLTDAQKLINLVNETVPISRVLKDLFNIHVPDGMESYRTHCPWRLEHSDKGLAKTFRAYAETNTGMCFATHGPTNPVKMWVYERGGNRYTAAKEMMSHYQVGPVKERYYDKMVRLVEELDEDESVDLSYVIQHVLPTHPNYLQYQFDGDVVNLVVECSETEFSDSATEFMEEFEGWKKKLWKVLDSKG